MVISVCNGCKKGPRLLHRGCVKGQVGIFCMECYGFLLSGHNNDDYRYLRDKIEDIKAMYNEMVVKGTITDEKRDQLAASLKDHQTAFEAMRPEEVA